MYVHATADQAPLLSSGAEQQQGRPVGSQSAGSGAALHPPPMPPTQAQEEDISLLSDADIQLVRDAQQKQQEEALLQVGPSPICSLAWYALGARVCLRGSSSKGLG